MQPDVPCFHLCGRSTPYGFSMRHSASHHILNKAPFANVSIYKLFLLEYSTQTVPLTYTNFNFKDVICSGIGSLIWLAIIILWISIFQYNRAAWGEFADSISFILPLGRA